jgi:hypothetical protein
MSFQPVAGKVAAFSRNAVPLLVGILGFKFFRSQRLAVDLALIVKVSFLSFSVGRLRIDG